MDLYLISPPEKSFIPQLPEVFESGVDWFQYRRPHRSDRVKQAELTRVAPMAQRHGVTLIVNDRPDLADLSGADGVHLGSEDMPAEDVKSTWPEMMVGATQRVDDQVESGADYLGVGPVFSPESKTVGESPCGWAAVENVQSNTEIPVFAIGGITIGRLGDVPANLEGVAVVSAVWEATDPVEAVNGFKEAMP